MIDWNSIAYGKDENKVTLSEEKMFVASDDVICGSLLDLSDDLKLEIEDKETSRSIIKYNEELIDAVTIIVKYYTSHSLVKEEDNG
jgi:hypothetical protein